MTSPISPPGAAATAAMGKPAGPEVFGVAVIRDFDLAWTKIVGGPSDRLFQAGSISKSIAALAALELVARGQINIDADANERLKSWRVPGPQATTLRQLLSHTSGLGVPFFPGYAQGADVPTPIQVLDGVSPAITAAVRVDPGAHGQFHYSGGGYVVVQQLVADITGLSFAAAARSLVLDPLGMTSSTYQQPLPGVRRGATARDDWHIYPEAAAAGLWTTPGDLARYLCALQAALAGRTSALRAEMAALVVLPHAALPATGDWEVLPTLGVRAPDAYGLGVFLEGRERFSHVGGADSFFSAFTGSTADGTGAVVMTAGDASPFLFEVLLAISDEDAWAGFRLPAAGLESG
jgi:CubicO group peptidase (beta-lactamase class C family)